MAGKFLPVLLLLLQPFLVRGGGGGGGGGGVVSLKEIIPVKLEFPFS